MGDTAGERSGLRRPATDAVCDDSVPHGQSGRCPDRLDRLGTESVLEQRLLLLRTVRVRQHRRPQRRLLQCPEGQVLLERLPGLQHLVHPDHYHVPHGRVRSLPPFP